ncbi:MAG: GSCFA domain-containing protein [Chthoniobacterales bacterium]
MLDVNSSTYVADGATARRNIEQRSCSRWHKKDSGPDDSDRQLASQRLREPLFIPALEPGFRLQRDDKFFAIGSCFARGIEKALLGRKMEVLSVAPEFASLQTINESVTGLGFTNKYNTFSIYNELHWALDPEAKFPRETIVELGDGNVVDPHINPTLPVAGAEETWRRRSLIQMVNRRAAECRVVIVTLGLIEAWRDTKADTFLNSTPFFDLLRLYPDRYEFHVTSFGQNLANLEGIHTLLARFGHHDVQIVVTVSPVPLMATFSGEDVVLANSYSKSLLRTVAQQWAAMHQNVHYFPSYEIVMNSDRARTWEPDLRHVKPEVTLHIMRLFLQAYLS